MDGFIAFTKPALLHALPHTLLSRGGRIRWGGRGGGQWRGGGGGSQNSVVRDAEFVVTRVLTRRGVPL